VKEEISKITDTEFDTTFIETRSFQIPANKQQTTKD